MPVILSLLGDSQYHSVSKCRSGSSSLSPNKRKVTSSIVSSDKQILTMKWTDSPQKVEAISLEMSLSVDTEKNQGLDSEN